MLKVKRRINNLKLRLYVWWQIKRGYIDKNLTPLKCPYCKSKKIGECNREVGGYNIPDGCLCEFDAVCEECGKIIGHWAYGSWDL